MSSPKRNIVLTSVSTLLLFLAVGYISCIKKNPDVIDQCKGVVCENGTCSEGKCICPPGFEGEKCEIKWSQKFKGVWNVTDEGGGKTDSFTVAINPSLTIAGSLVIDKFWIYKADGIIGNMAEVNSFTFKPAQNVRPGYFDLYLLQSGDGTIDKSGQNIDGTYIINDPKMGDVSYTFHMTRHQ
jgi:hypothetical protein